MVAKSLKVIRYGSLININSSDLIQQLLLVLPTNEIIFFFQSFFVQK